MILFLILLFLLFGGGGFFMGGPRYGGSGIGVFLVILVVLYLMGYLGGGRVR